MRHGKSYIYCMIRIGLSLATGLILLVACKEVEQHPCYDASLVHDNACTTDCPGVCGCDGLTYCNECEAHRLGIAVVSDTVCD